MYLLWRDAWDLEGQSTLGLVFGNTGKEQVEAFVRGVVWCDGGGGGRSGHHREANRFGQWHLQSATPATISRAPSRVRDNILSL